MLEKYIKKIFILTLTIIITINVINANCNTNNTCPNTTICSESGLCVCPQYYYGANCDQFLEGSKNLVINTSGVSGGSFMGMIIGLVVSFPIILVIGLVLIFYIMKDRDY